MIEWFQRLSQNLSNKILYQYYPRAVDILTLIATFRASRKLKIANVERILVDSTVLAHGVTHKTAWVSTGKMRWGNVFVDSGYAARIPVHDDHDTKDAARSIRYLPSIASLARRGHLRLATSCELRDEQWSHPAGRFHGYGIYDYSLFRNITFETIKDTQYSVIYGVTGLPRATPKEQRFRRLKEKTDPLFKELLSVLGPNNSQDAWHIATAEQNHCYCFLTMDFQLIRNIRAQAMNKTIQSLKTLILTPEEFGRRFSIIPIRPRMFSYHNASFPVIHKENWPDSKRHRPTKNK